MNKYLAPGHSVIRKWRSDFDRFEPDNAADVVSVISFNRFDTGDAANASCRSNKVRTLQYLEAAILELKPRGVKCTSFVSNQDNALEPMNFDEEFQFIDDTLCLKVGLGMVGQTGRAARKGNPVISRQLQAILKKIVKLLADSTIGAVNGCGVNSCAVVGDGTLIG